MHIMNLQSTVKSQKKQLADFKSGEKYVRMQAAHKNQIAEKDEEIKRLKHELSKSQSQTSNVRKIMQEANEDLEKEMARKLRKKDREIKKLEERALKTERQRDLAEEKLTEKYRELYAVMSELEEENGRNKKLLAQLNRDYENSSIPSSMSRKKKKIVNNREKTGRHPGGQPGHAGHARKKQKPTRVVVIPPPDEYLNSHEYATTGKTIKKQMVSLRICVDTTEYTTEQFRSRKTGKLVHAPFPPGFFNEVNYAGSVKAFPLLLNSWCNVSIDKSIEFLKEITDGRLNISKGMVSGLTKQFSKKTKTEQAGIIAGLLRAPVMNVDFTNARVSGKSAQVLICANQNEVGYFAKGHKGHEGIKQTPAEDYQGIMVHDHDKTFYSYGSSHQECLAHTLRYLKDSIQNEPGLTWNKSMRDLIREMIHCRNSLDSDENPNPDEIEAFENRYKEILKTAKKEYEYEPPSRYYKEGYNLYLKLDKYMTNHLVFLHDKRVPADNNLAERLLRGFKRKQKQAMTFRSFESLDHLCRFLSVIVSGRADEHNIYRRIAEILE